MQARKHKPKEGNVQQIGGLTFSSGSLSLSLSLSLSFSLRAMFQGSHPCIQLYVAFLGYINICFIFPILCWAIPFGCRHVCIIFTCTLLRHCSLVMIISALYFSYLTRPYPWNISNVYFTFLCVIALCTMYVRIYIYIYICLRMCW